MREPGAEVPEDAYVFSSDPAGAVPWNPDTMTRRYRRYADRVGIRSSPKELRHYSATQLLSNGVDLNTVAGRPGHAEGSTTLRSMVVNSTVTAVRGKPVSSAAAPLSMLGAGSLPAQASQTPAQATPVAALCATRRSSVPGAGRVQIEHSVGHDEGVFGRRGSAAADVSG